MEKHPLLDPVDKTPYVLVAVQFSRSNQTYVYRAAEDLKLEPGQRVVTANHQSFSIPTVVGVYPAGSKLEEDAVDWIVQVVDTTRYESMKREYAL